TQESDKHVRGPFKRAQGNPFVRRVRMGDVSRAKYHAGNAAGGENGGIAKIIHANGLALADAAEKLPDQRQPGVRFHRRTRRLATRAGGDLKFSSSEKG